MRQLIICVASRPWDKVLDEAAERTLEIVVSFHVVLAPIIECLGFKV